MLLLEHLQIPYVGLSLTPESNSLYSRINQFHMDTEFFQDIRDLDEITKIFYQLRPQVIIHMAAQPLVIDSYRDPVGTFSTNVMGTVNVLEAARSLKKQVHLGVITTDKVYRNNSDGQKFTESDPIMGTDPYSASKGAAENAISAWKSLSSPESELHISALRAGNVVGGGDFSANRLMPDIVRSLVAGKVPAIRNPDSVRPWQHVLDPLVGYLLALEKSIEFGSGSDYNFGPLDQAISVQSAAEIAVTTWDPRLQIDIQKKFDLMYEAKFLDLSATKAVNELNWSPVWTQAEAISKTILWWKSLKSVSARDACEKDIVTYFKDLS